MEKKIITGIICVPTTNDAKNVFEALNRISGMLGHLHCSTSDDAALLKYNGLISSEHKNKLEDIAEQYHFILTYIEMYDDDERLTNNTINLIN